MNRRNFIKTTSIAALAVKLAKALPVKPRQSRQTATVLFQGDSITDGGRWINSTDWNHVLGQGYAFIIAGELCYKHPDQNLMFYNRGISGNTVHDLADRWDKDTLELKPDILSILVGANDVYGVIHNKDPKSADDFHDTYTQLLIRTKDALPDTRLVIMEPFILPVGQVNENFSQWQAEIVPRQAIVKEIAEKFNAVFIPLQSHFNDACKKAPANHWIWDGIHPMPAGHQLMAGEWTKAVRRKLDFPG